MAEARMLEAWVNRERATEDLELQTGTFLSLGLMINEIATNVIKHGFETAG